MREQKRMFVVGDMVQTEFSPKTRGRIRRVSSVESRQCESGSVVTAVGSHGSPMQLDANWFSCVHCDTVGGCRCDE